MGFLGFLFGYISIKCYEVGLDCSMHSVLHYSTLLCPKHCGSVISFLGFDVSFVLILTLFVQVILFSKLWAQAFLMLVVSYYKMMGLNCCVYLEF